jgi:hypothetical protein
MALSKRPHPTARPSLLTVYDGRTCIGILLMRGKAGVEAFDRDDRSLGIFETQELAARAISAAFTRGEAAA